MTFEQAEKFKFNPFDLTKVWPHSEYPLIKVGKFVLNKNPKNYFAEVEQSAFSPASLVPGIEPSPDKMLQVKFKSGMGVVFPSSQLIFFLSFRDVFILMMTPIVIDWAQTSCKFRLIVHSGKI